MYLPMALRGRTESGGGVQARGRDGEEKATSESARRSVRSRHRIATYGNALEAGMEGEARGFWAMMDWAPRSVSLITGLRTSASAIIGPRETALA